MGDTNFKGMSHMARDKYMQGLSDVGLQTILESDEDQDVKDLAQAHIGDRAKKKEEEMVAGAAAKGKDNARPDTLNDKVNRGNERYGKKA